VLAVIAVLVAGSVLVALVHKPSQAQRASDLRGFLSHMNTDIESCAGGVSESLSALRQAGTNASEIQDTISIATYGASNCEPANNMQIDDLEQFQVTESLASFHLASVVTGLVNWAAPDAVNVQTDVATMLAASSPAAKAKDMAALQQALRKLNAQRAAVDAAMESAIRSLSAHAAPPSLPG
jgi:cytoskeletal protein RodZ